MILWALVYARALTSHEHSERLGASRIEGKRANNGPTEPYLLSAIIMRSVKRS